MARSTTRRRPLSFCPADIFSMIINRLGGGGGSAGSFRSDDRSSTGGTRRDGGVGPSGGGDVGRHGEADLGWGSTGNRSEPAAPWGSRGNSRCLAGCCAPGEPVVTKLGKHGELSGGSDRGRAGGVGIVRVNPRICRRWCRLLLGHRGRRFSCSRFRMCGRYPLTMYQPSHHL
jgi:hypothetical protein